MAQDGVLWAMAWPYGFLVGGRGHAHGSGASGEWRSSKETALHGAAALSFAWTTSCSYRWLRERW